MENLTPTPEANATLGAALSSEGAPAAAGASNSASNGASNPASASNPAADPAAPAKESPSQFYLALAKEKKRAMDLQRELKEARAQLAQRDTEKPAPAKKAGNPLEALQAAGYSYKDATDFLLNNESLTPEQQVKAVREEIEALRREREEERENSKKDSEQRMVEARAEAESNFKGEIGEFISQNGDTFELVSQEEPEQAVNLIYALIAAHHVKSVEECKETGARPRILSVKEGAELAEKWYEERLERFNKTKKMQSRFQPKPPEAPTDGGARGSRTLANAGASGSAGSGAPAMTDEERFERAMAAAERAVQARKGAQT